MHLFWRDSPPRANTSRNNVGDRREKRPNVTKQPRKKVRMDQDACLAVEKELDRVMTRFDELQESTGACFVEVATLYEDLLETLHKAEQEMVNIYNTSTQVDGPGDIEMSDESDMQVEMEPAPARLSEPQINNILDTLRKANERVQQLSINHRDIHGTVSKVGKVIDRNFVSDYTAITRIDALQDDHNMMLLNKVMAKHYCRQGMDDVAQLLIKESGMPEEMAQEVFASESSFAEVYSIWKAIQQQELGPALEWAARYSNELIAKNSSLEFKLHRLAFLQIVSRGMDAQAEAIAYARNNFSKFIDRFETEIPTLMGCFIYLPLGIEKSPYAHLISPEIWTEASYIFMKDACNTLGISKNSALSVVINAGCTALPALLNIKQVMQSRQVLSIWSGRDELPIEIELDPENRYHSIFACPILRQQTTEDNPPKRLTCGHVISNDALHKLSNAHILKCPYCPVEQNADEAVRIYF
ncbi:E3 ubiquitin-protein ligase RMND5A isoform X2 [Teleopsis dalmanni]|uniref:E3 ubiquitin-protein ligase RMND5A isoform X2 n=1 Tax=Teleopsis dalmanni TaxID=139649 RepID=UPI0018CDC663|nr:E3 ubiquitin-protein ligase RMND5A isoform X2 [Teleopsis dalmanni]